MLIDHPVARRSAVLRPHVLGRIACATIAIALVLGAAAPPAHAGPVTPRPARAPAFLRLIPADTPYVWVSLQPMPRAITERLIGAAGDVIAAAFESAPTGLLYGDKPIARVLRTIKDELGGRPLPEALASVGISLTARSALYGIGLVPVFRVELADGRKLEAFLERLAKEGDEKLPVARHRKHRYWRFEVRDAAIVVAVRPDELLVTLVPLRDAGPILDVAFGDRRPARSLAQADTLDRMIARHAFTRTYVGYIDVVRLVRMFTGDVTARERRVLRGFDLEPSKVSDTCRRELVGMARRAARIVFGTTKLTDRRVESEVTLELDASLARDLAALRAPTPALKAAPPRSIFSGGAAVDMDKALAFVRGHAEAVAAAPFRCEVLADWNTAAKDVIGGLANVPPLVRQLRSLTFALTGMTKSPNGEPDFHGWAVLSATDPMQLVQLARQLVPALARLHVPPDGRPVALPAGALPLRSAWAALKGQRLGVAVGPGGNKELARVMRAPAPAERPFLKLAYNARAFMDMLRQLGEDDETMKLLAANPLWDTEVDFALDASRHGLVMRMGYTLP